MRFEGNLQIDCCMKHISQIPTQIVSAPDSLLFCEWVRNQQEKMLHCYDERKTPNRINRAEQILMKYGSGLKSVEGFLNALVSKQQD